MHILHISPYYAPAYAYGGVVSALEGMAQALAARGHSIAILTTDILDRSGGRATPAYEKQGPIEIRRVPNLLPGLRSAANLSTPLRLRTELQALLPRVDVVHLHEFRSVEALLSLPAAHRAGVPVLLSPHGTLIYETGRGTLKRLWDSLLSPGLAKSVDHVLALTSQEEADARALWDRLGADQTRFSVVPNGVDPAPFAHLPERQQARARWALGAGPVLLFLGRLHERKGILTLLRAFQVAGVPDAQMLIAGPDEGMLPALKAVADERVIFAGYLQGDERLAAFAAADLFALPAVGEGLSVAALEAMAAGLPVLLSPGCNLPEAETAGAGRIVPPTMAALSEALRELLPDAAKRAAMGQAARALVESRFSWEVVAAQLEAAYTGAIQNPDA